jgi:phage-related protein
LGYALHLAQLGKKHAQAKPLHDLGCAGVLEIVDDWRGNAYRAVAAAVFVLHVLQKKAKRRIATPKADLEFDQGTLKVFRASHK